MTSGKGFQVLTLVALGVALWSLASVNANDPASRPTKAERHGNPPKGMVLIPGGAFLMGSTDPKTSREERPAHLVEVDPFYIDATEVTNREFARFVKETGYITIAEKAPTMEEIMAQLPPGTPEPDRFRDGAGHAALVSIAGPGATPRIAACPTARFHWREAVLDLGVQPDPKAGIGEILPDGRKLPDTLLKLTLTGTVRMADRAAWTRALDDLGDTLRWLDINDSTLISLIEADDLDRIGRQGALRDAAEALNAARQDMSRTPEDRAAAGLALDLLVSWALEAEDTA